MHGSTAELQDVRVIGLHHNVIGLSGCDWFIMKNRARQDMHGSTAELQDVRGLHLDNMSPMSSTKLIRSPETRTMSLASPPIRTRRWTPLCPLRPNVPWA
eukprot:3465326-Heterocapsa_arctica.AAC.1